MRREALKEQESNLIFHAPLTSSGMDIIGGKMPSVSGSVSYSENGVRLQNNSLLIYDFTTAEAVTAKTIHCEIVPYSQVNTYDYAYVFGHYYNNTPYFRAAICRPRSRGTVYLTLSRSSNRYDFDTNTTSSFTINTYRKLTFVLGENTQRLYCDGVQIWSSSGTDTWNCWGFGSIILTLGGTGNSARSFNGCIRNFMMFNKALTASEVAQL